MSSDDDDDDVTAQAFAGLKGHVDGYKHYMSKLKKGARSGISQSFGNAADLLPPEHLTQYKRVEKPLEASNPVLKENADPNLLRQAVEQLVLMANADGQGLPARQDGREIIAVLFEDGKKMLMYDDYSVEPAPEPIAQMVEAAPASTTTSSTTTTTTTSTSSATATPTPTSAPTILTAAQVLNSNVIPPTAAEPAGSVARFPSPQQNSITSSFSYAGPTANPPAPAAAVAPAPAPHQEGSIDPSELSSASVLLPSSVSVPTPVPALAPTLDPVSSSSERAIQSGESTADLHVTTANGTWLWDITTDGEDVALIVTSEGTIIQKADGNNFVVTQSLKPGQKVPHVEIVADVTVDPDTGNIYYQNISGTQAIALLNNGWRIDQIKRAGSDDEYFVTEPYRAGQDSPVRQQVASLTIDPETGEIKYDTIDGGATMTLKCRSLG